MKRRFASVFALVDEEKIHQFDNKMTILMVRHGRARDTRAGQNVRS